MTQKLPQPQIPKKTENPYIRGEYDLGTIRAHGKLWHYEYATHKLSVARAVKTRTERDVRMKAIIRKYYDIRIPMYFVFARWKKS